MNRCTFNQTTKFTSLIPPHDEHFEQIQCENMTEEQFDEYGRVYCKEHMIKVENIRRKMAQKYINEYKEKLINALRHRYKLLWDKITQSTNSDNIYYLQAKIFEIEDWIEKIENGEFDNE